MIIYSFNDEIKHAMHEKKLRVIGVSVKDKTRLNLDVQHIDTKKYMKIVIDNFKFSEGNFEIEGAYLVGASIKRFNQVYKTKYFHAKNIHLKEANSQKETSIESGAEF